MATSTSSRIFIPCLIMLMVAFVVVMAADTTQNICNVGVSELAECLPAITGDRPSFPTKGCCKVMHKVNLQCLCNYKDKFLKYGISPKNAMALPQKCGLKLPKQCQGKH